MYYIVQGWPNVVNEELIPYLIRRDSMTIEQDCVVMGFRIVIPASLRKQTLSELHFNHPGIVKMKAIARSYVWWPNIDKDVEKLVKQCEQCQVTQKAPCIAPLQSWPIAKYPYERIHIDFAEKNNKHYLLIVDSFSKWADIILVPNMTTTKTISVLRSLFASYGLPKELVSDNGTQFTAYEFKTFLKNNGVKQTLTPPYHSASNGAAERLVQTFKLSFNKNDNLNDEHKLTNFLFAYRNTPHQSTGQTPAQLFMNRPLRTRLSLMRPDPTLKLEKSKDLQAVNHNKRYGQPLREFCEGDSVLVRSNLGKNLWDKGVVLLKTGPVTYRVSVRYRNVLKHVDQLIKFKEPTIDPAFSFCKQSTNFQSNPKPSDVIIPEPEKSTPTATEKGSNVQTKSEEVIAARYPQRSRLPPERLTYS
jgi:hypothetical protein